MLQRYLNLKEWAPFLKRFNPLLGILSGLMVLIAMIWGLGIAPADYQQGDAYRIIFIHVPAAFLSLGLYTAMALSALIYLIFRIKLLDTLVWAIAPVGATFTLVALITGAIWGKPMWGTWWVWDARLTSELILWFIYLGVMGLYQGLAREGSSRVPAHVLAVVAWVNIPIIHFSVQWWNTLHQGPTLSQWARPPMAAEMLWPLLFSLCAFSVLALYQVCLRLELVVEDPLIPSPT